LGLRARRNIPELLVVSLALGFVLLLSSFNIFSSQAKYLSPTSSSGVDGLGITGFSSLAVSITTTSASSLAKGAVNLENRSQAGQTGVSLTLSLEKTSYASSEVARVTVAIRNTGDRTVEIGKLERAFRLIVYDQSRNIVGTWIGFQKAQVMRSQANSMLLAPGQTYSWTIAWDLSVYQGPSSVLQKLSTGEYLLQGSITTSLYAQSNIVGPEPVGTTVVSNLVRFSIS
jgi:hypothetical protein